MQLSHHEIPSRSFVLLTIIVLCTVYAALVLTRINRLYVKEQPPVQQTAQAQVHGVTPADTTDWEQFEDKDYPLSMLVPEGAQVRTHDDFENLYLVTVSETDMDMLVRIFVGKDQPSEISSLQSKDFTTTTGYAGTNYDNVIYQFKSGDYYYTFDGTATPERAAELMALVNSAELK